MNIYREGENEPSETITVNDVMAGQTEGYLFEADAGGEVVISVKDAYNKYNEEGESSYSFAMSKYSGYLDDGNSEENPTIVTELPYSSEGPYYLAGEDGDRDFFRFTAEELQVMEVKMTGIPGVNPTINAYFAEDFDQEIPEEMLEGIPEEILEEIMAEDPWPFASSNANGVGQGETLSFEAMPGQEYVIEVTNTSDMMFDPFILLFDPYFFDMFEPRSAHIPYELSIRGEVLPEDEDNFPLGDMFGMPTEEMPEEDFIEIPEAPEDMASYLQKQYTAKQLFDIIYGGMDQGEFSVSDLVEMATPYELGSDLSGYFQTEYDIDLVKIETDAEGIFELDWNETDSMEPVIEVYKYDEEEDFLHFVTDTYGWGMMPSDDETSLTVGLEANETYLLQLSNRSYQPSLDAYELTSSVIVENPSDAYENNNLPEDAADLPNFSFNGNFGLTGDVDIFYMEAEEDGIYGFHLEVLHEKRHQLRGMPADLYTMIDPMVMIVEDAKGDREIAYDSPAYMFDRGWDNEDEYGSFKVKEGSGYFIIIQNWFNDPSLTPYRMTVAEAHMVDGEETGSIAEQATNMRKVSSSKWHATDFLAAGKKDGDVNYYAFSLDQKADVQITFDVPHDIDGEITLYDQKGNKIDQSSGYSQGDAEVLIKTLERGKYYVGVKDIEGNPSIRAYDVTIDLLK